MAETWKMLMDKYNYVINDLSDFRTKDFPLISSPIPVILIVIAYLEFCINYGPRFMQNRKPYKLKYPVMLYNIFQIGLSCYLVHQGLQYLVSKDYNFVCDPLVKNTTDPRLLNVANGAWFYFFAKITELLDTIFFVFRKKKNQISTLHLYHHSIVTISAWIFAKYYPGGPIVLVGTLNSFVHVLMYSYYLLSGLGPQYQKYLWWKKYMTQIQLIQFVIVIAHNTTALFNDCNYPKAIHIFIIMNTGLVMALFIQFYIKSYLKNNSKKNEDINGKPSKSVLNRRKMSIGQ